MPSPSATLQTEPRARLLAIAKPYFPLWPLVTSMAAARSGAIVASYESYAKTDAGIFSDGSMLITLGILLVFFIFIVASKRTLQQSTVNRLAYACIAIEAATLVALSALGATQFDDTTREVRFMLCAACNLSVAGALFYWLRCMRGAGTTLAVAFSFSALALSEVFLYACTLMPSAVAKLLAAALVLMQFPCMREAGKLDHLPDSDTVSSPTDYFSFAQTMLSSKKFLAATAIGVGFLSLVIGFLRGFPSGDPIGFTPFTRALYAALTIALSLGIIVLALRKHRHIMTTNIFVLMEALACAALLCYALFPQDLQVGAVFTTTLNAIMMAFTWYVIIAFMSAGWRDPYYYAIAGQFVYLGSRSLSRVALLVLPSFEGSTLLISALIGVLLVTSTQVILIQFLDIMGKQHIERENLLAQIDLSTLESTLAGAEPKKSTGGDNLGNSRLIRVMGLDEAGSMADMRQAAMQHSIEELGRQFLLSDREVEVLTLYAQGFTQKRVAEELFISQGTAHAHIKRIYAKTGLHSRQEILDYLTQYTS